MSGESFAKQPSDSLIIVCFVRLRNRFYLFLFRGRKREKEGRGAKGAGPFERMSVCVALLKPPRFPELGTYLESFILSLSAAERFLFFLTRGA